MTTQQLSLEAYRSHTLDIMMRTSSGDVIKIGLENEQSLDYSGKKFKGGSMEMMRFSSMQSFSFSIDSNGIDEQDKKEVAAFMQKAQPYLDDFIKELQEGNQKSPIAKVAREISDIFASFKQEDTNKQNLAKNGIVKMFDNALEQTQTHKEVFDRLFKESQKLLERVLEFFDAATIPIYA